MWRCLPVGSRRRFGSHTCHACMCWHAPIPAHPARRPAQKATTIYNNLEPQRCSSTSGRRRSNWQGARVAGALSPRTPALAFPRSRGAPAHTRTHTRATTTTRSRPAFAARIRIRLRAPQKTPKPRKPEPPASDPLAVIFRFKPRQLAPSIGRQARVCTPQCRNRQACVDSLPY